MAVIDDAFLSELKARTKLSNVLRRFSSVKLPSRLGANFSCNCPLHDDETPSFSGNDANGLWKCHGCDKQGDAITLVRELTGQNFSEAVATLADLAGMDVPSGRAQPGGSGSGKPKKSGAGKASAAATPKEPESDSSAVSCGEGVEAQARDADIVAIFPSISSMPLPPDGVATPQAGKRFDYFKETGESTSVAPAQVHAYRDFEGRLLGFILRVEKRETKENGKRRKFFIPLTWGVPGVEEGTAPPVGSQEWWVSKGFPSPKPIYGAETLAASVEDAPDDPTVDPDAPLDLRILIVEGEKTADAARRLLAGPDVPLGPDAPRRVVLSPMNGSGSFGLANWGGLVSFLAARRERIGALRFDVWPDADADPGKVARARKEIAERLVLELADAQLPGEVFFVEPDAAPSIDGWDLADAEEEGWTGSRALERLEQAARVEPPPPPTGGQAEDPVVVRLVSAAAPEDGIDGPGGAPRGAGENGPVWLGFLENVFYAQSAVTREIVGVRSSDMNGASGLTQFANESFWRALFPGEKGRIDWGSAGGWAREQCAAEGVWDPSKVCGRGVWTIDGGRYRPGSEFLVSFGSRLDRVSMDPASPFEGLSAASIGFGRRFGRVFAPGSGMSRPDFTAAPSPCDDPGVVVLEQIMRALSWGPECALLAPAMLMGWMALAPLSGVLNWRTHIWLAGRSGVGKSWVARYVVRAVLGDWAFGVSSLTSEPGLRRLLRADALPIIFDEAPGGDEFDRRKLLALLKLARAASQQDGAGQIVQAGEGGGPAMSYCVRSPFLISAPDAWLESEPDFKRFTVLRLVERMAPATFEREIEGPAHEFLTPDFSKRFVARSIARMPATMEAISSISAWMARSVERRVADLYGSLFGGYFGMCYEGRLPTPGVAGEWLCEAGLSSALSETAEDVASRSDAETAFDKVMAEPVDIEADGIRRRLTLGMICAALLEDEELSGLPPQVLRDRIAMMGVRVFARGEALPRASRAASNPDRDAATGGAAFASSSPLFDRILKGGPLSFETAFLGMGSAYRTAPLRFPGRTQSRAIFVPAKHFSSLDRPSGNGVASGSNVTVFRNTRRAAQ